jgi:hypothetical protein
LGFLGKTAFEFGNEGITLLVYLVLYVEDLLALAALFFLK